MQRLNKKEWITKVNYLIGENIEEIYPKFIGNEDEAVIEYVGNNLRRNPCPYCGHNDTFTTASGEAWFHCFSIECEEHGTHYKLFRDKSGLSEHDLIAKLSKTFSIPEPFIDPELEERIKVCDKVANVFHNAMMKDKDYLDYQQTVRKHDVETLKKYRVGKSLNYQELMRCLELNERRLAPFIPGGLFVYTYEDPETGNIRFNTKNPFKAKDNRGIEIKGYSTGEKALLYSKPFTYEEVFVVEGENDLFTLVEAGAKSVVALGGSPSDKQIEELMKFSKIYLMLDNDDGGKNFTAVLNDKLPHIPVRQIVYDEKFKDPDDYFKNNPEPCTLDELKHAAVELTTDKFHIEYRRGVWFLKTRELIIKFKPTGVNKNGTLIGDLSIHSQEEQINEMQIKLAMYKHKIYSKYVLSLAYEINKYRNEPNSNYSVDELLDIYKFSSKQLVILKLLAEKTADNIQDENLLEEITNKIGIKARDELLREINDIKNIALLEQEQRIFPKIRISSYFNVKNNDGYFFYPCIVKDGDTIRKIPFLLSNTGQKIRLDLFKRKDQQSLLLLNGKYEIPNEVPSVILEPEDASLNQKWADKFAYDEVQPGEINITGLIEEIEAFLRQFYYTDNEDIYKVIAMWIYGTYYYELFRQYPYLLLNGSKGSGKTSLGSVLKYLTFNARHLIDITGPMLFRTISIEGGTLILDEMEFLNDTKKSSESDIGMLIKAGYAKGAKTRRMNMDTMQPEDFDIDSPKAIITIFGVDPIINDRCITINTKESDPSKTFKLEDVMFYCSENIDQIRDLTSRCCLSALAHFQEIFKIYRHKEFIAGSARLSQIIWPIMTIAKAAGDEYVKSLERYYNVYIKNLKAEMESNTPEGALKQVVIEAAYELKGLKKPYVTDDKRYNYDKKIELKSGSELKIKGIKGEFNDNEEYLCLNSLHLIELIEDRLPNSFIKVAEVHQWMVHKFSDIFIANRSSIPFDHEALINKFNGKSTITGKRYYIPISELIKGNKDVSEYESEEEILRGPNLFLVGLEKSREQSDTELKDIAAKYF